MSSVILSLHNPLFLHTSSCREASGPRWMDLFSGDRKRFGVGYLPKSSIEVGQPPGIWATGAELRFSAQEKLRPCGSSGCRSSNNRPAPSLKEFLPRGTLPPGGRKPPNHINERAGQNAKENAPGPPRAELGRVASLEIPAPIRVSCKASHPVLRFPRSAGRNHRDPSRES